MLLAGVGMESDLPFLLFLVAALAIAACWALVAKPGMWLIAQFERGLTPRPILVLLFFAGDAVAIAALIVLAAMPHDPIRDWALAAAIGLASPLTLLCVMAGGGLVQDRLARGRGSRAPRHSDPSAPGYPASLRVCAADRAALPPA